MESIFSGLETLFAVLDSILFTMESVFSVAKKTVGEALCEASFWKS
jgi:hypothetical protein